MGRVFDGRRYRYVGVLGWTKTCGGCFFSEDRYERGRLKRRTASVLSRRSVIKRDSSDASGASMSSSLYKLLASQLTPSLPSHRPLALPACRLCMRQYLAYGGRPSLSAPLAQLLVYGHTEGHPDQDRHEHPDQDCQHDLTSAFHDSLRRLHLFPPLFCPPLCYRQQAKRTSAISSVLKHAMFTAGLTFGTSNHLRGQQPAGQNAYVMAGILFGS